MDRNDELVRDWVDAERRDAGEADDRDRAFAALFAAVPPLEPRPGFARRVTRAVRRARRPGALRWWRPDAVGLAPARIAAAVALAVVTLAALYFAARGVGAFLVTSLPRAMTAAAQAVVWLTIAIESGLDLWGIAARVGRALGSAAATPGMTLGLVAIEVVGGAALFALYRLLASEQESDRGDPIQIVRRL